MIDDRKLHEAKVEAARERQEKRTRPFKFVTKEDNAGDMDPEFHLIRRIETSSSSGSRDKIEHIGHIVYHERELYTMANLDFHRHYCDLFPNEDPPSRLCSEYYHCLLPHRLAPKWEWLDHNHDRVEAYSHTALGNTLTIERWCPNPERLRR